MSGNSLRKVKYNITILKIPINNKAKTDLIILDTENTTITLFMVKIVR